MRPHRISGRGATPTARPLRWAFRALPAAWALALAACQPTLPESDSAGAKLYVERCQTCHRLYPPNVMTAATWKVMLDRMQGEMARRGVPPLSGDEMRLALDYLTRNALDAGARESEGERDQL